MVDPPGQGSPLRGGLIALYLGLALMLTLVHGYQVNLDPDHALLRAKRHMMLVNGQGHAPWAYRIAVPHMANPGRIALAKRGVDFQLAHEVPYLILRAVFTFAGLLLFHAFLATWLAPSWVLAGVFLFTALHPATYFHYWFQPASALDLVLWLTAALIGLRGRTAWIMVPLVFFGAINRETVVFATLVWAAMRYRKDPTGELLLRLVGLWAIWGSVFLGLRWLIPALPREDPLTSLIRENLSHPGYWLYFVAFFGAMWWLAFVGWSRRPLELRLLALAMVPYVVINLIWGRVREVRLFLPVSMVLIPMTLMALRDMLEPAAARVSRTGTSEIGRIT